MYKLNNNSVTRLADGASIPFANGNRDYEEYKQWLVEGNTPEPEFTEEELVQIELAQKIQEAKKAKELALSSIKVTTKSGKEFDGRDIDQQRMVAAIMTADIVLLTEIQWKLADNLVEIIPISELKEALTLSIQALGSIIRGEV